VSDGATAVKRVGIVLSVLGCVFFAFWFLLPTVRGLLLPEAEPGSWIVGPHRALRFGACTIISAVTLPLALRPLQRGWRERDLATRGAPLDPLASRPGTRVGLLIKGGLLFVVYTVCAAFYWISYTRVSPDGIAVRSPLGTRSYSYSQIEALERAAPAAGEAEKYTIRFSDSSWAHFSADHEGTTALAIERIAAYVADRSGRRWARVAR
jgi:hypothetical protein